MNKIKNIKLKAKIRKLKSGPYNSNGSVKDGYGVSEYMISGKKHRTVTRPSRNKTNEEKRVMPMMNPMGEVYNDDDDNEEDADKNINEDQGINYVEDFHNGKISLKNEDGTSSIFMRDPDDETDMWKDQNGKKLYDSKAEEDRGDAQNLEFWKKNMN